MRERWKLPPDVLDKRPIQLCQRHSRTPRQPVENQPPRIDQQAVAEGFPAIAVPSALGRGDDITLIFNGAGAE